MAKTRKLTLTYPDGEQRTPTTARNYMYAVHITKRDANLKKGYEKKGKSKSKKKKEGKSERSR